MSHYLQAVASPPNFPFLDIVIVASVGADVLSLVRQLTEEREPTEELVPRVKVKPFGQVDTK